MAEFFIAMQQPKLKKKHIFHSFFFLEILSRPKSLLLICPFLKNYRANIFETKKKTLTPSKGKLTFFLLKNKTNGSHLANLNMQIFFHIFWGKIDDDFVWQRIYVISSIPSLIPKKAQFMDMSIVFCLFVFHSSCLIRRFRIGI